MNDGNEDTSSAQVGGHSTTTLEQQRLAATNNPGQTEEGTMLPTTRNRLPSSVAARATFNQAVRDFKEILGNLQRPDHTGLPTPIQTCDSNHRLAKDLETKLRSAADELIQSVSNDGASNEVQEIQSQVVMLQSQLMSIDSGTKRVASDQGSSRTVRFAGGSSISSSNSSRRRLAIAELERRQAQESFEKRADQLRRETEQRRAVVELEQLDLQDQQAKLQDQQAKLQDQQAKIQRKKQTVTINENLNEKRVQFQIEELTRQGEMAGLEAEINALDREEENNTIYSPNIEQTDDDNIWETTAEPTENVNPHQPPPHTI